MPDNGPSYNATGAGPIPDWDDSAVEQWESILRNKKAHEAEAVRRAEETELAAASAAGLASPKGKRVLDPITGVSAADQAPPEAGGGPSVHSVWQIYQDGQISKGKFIEALGGNLPAATLRLLDQVDCTFPQFVKSFGQFL